MKALTGETQREAEEEEESNPASTHHSTDAPRLELFFELTLQHIAVVASRLRRPDLRPDLRVFATKCMRGRRGRSW